MDVCGCVLGLQAGEAIASAQSRFPDGFAICTRPIDARWACLRHLRTDQARNGYYGWVPVQAPAIVSFFGLVKSYSC